MFYPAFLLVPVLHLFAWQQQPVRVVPRVSLSAQSPLTPPEISAMEQRIAANPADLKTRSRLLRFYAESGSGPQPEEEYRAARLAHIQYVVNEIPQSDIAGSLLCYAGASSGPYANPADHAAIAGLWLTQASRRFDDNKVVLNALRFLGIEDKQQAEDLFERSIAAHPADLEVVARLGFFYAAGLVGADSLGGLALANLTEDSRTAWAAHCRSALDRSVNPHVLMGAAIALPNLAMRRTGGGRAYESWVSYSEDIRKRAGALDSAATASRTMPVEFKMFADESQREVPSQPQPISAPTQLAPTQIRVGGNVQATKLISKASPEYPAQARTAGIQGTVRLRAAIATDGTVKNLQLISGHPLLVQSAVDAVKSWTYQTTLLNGVPVEVVTTIDVNFTLVP